VIVLVDDFRQQDQENVRALILRGLRDHWGDVDPTLNQDLDDLAAAHRDGRIVVVRDGADIVATGTVVRRGPGTAEIVRMSVDGSRRRSGLGRIVTDELVDTARRWGCERVVLETTQAWTDVVAFYQSCGFRITHAADGEFGRDVWFERSIAAPPVRDA
jgi:GNAT superfamily N-acetyltransferase